MPKRKGQAVKWTPEKILDLRERYGETQKVFCHRVGVDYTTIRWWEQGRGKPLGSAELLLDRLEEDLINGKIRELETAGAKPCPSV
jgi:DNA-binding transcriptional regulator YiaG